MEDAKRGAHSRTVKRRQIITGHNGVMIMAQPKSERDTLGVDYSRCPLPKTHRRLVEAHVLWHQSLDRYQQPALFQANLNATIQALRNTTFVLQSEKHLFSKFEDWYGPWQERMKADPVLRWLIAARNTVVKEGELETASTGVKNTGVRSLILLYQF